MLSQHISIYVSVSKQTIATYMLLPVMMVVLSRLKLQELEKLLHDSYVKYVKNSLQSHGHVTYISHSSLLTI